MNTGFSNFHEVRFLLHSDRNYYDNQETLYVVSQTSQSALWQKVANTAIANWRIVPALLADIIPRGSWTNFNVEELSPASIIGEISSAEIDPTIFSDEEREELLLQVSIARLPNQGNQDLWRSLRLHETVDGNFVAITDATYRASSSFDLHPALQGIITLIENTERPNWIPEWTPKSAIDIILKQEYPEQYAEILLSLFSQATKQQEEALKTTAWLPLISGEAIAPRNVVFLPNSFSDKQVQRLSSKLDSVLNNISSNFTSLSILKSAIGKNSSNLKTLRSLGSEWYENNILEYLLQDVNNPHEYCSLILDTLQVLVERRQTLSEKNFSRLKNSQWLINLDGFAIHPHQVIDFPELITEVSEILEVLRPLQGDGYVTPMLLQSEISVCLNDGRLRTLFTNGDAALEQIRAAFGLTDKYNIGNLEQECFDVHQFLDVLQDFSGFPVIFVASKLSREKFRNYILSEILKPISDSLIKEVLLWIVDKYPNPSEQVINLYNQYLRLAINNLPTFGKEILPEIKLLNQEKSKQWKHASELCDGQKFTGIMPKFILNQVQRDILKSYLDSINSIDGQTNTSTLLNNPERRNEKILEEYFRPWRPYVPSELIGAFLCLLVGDGEHDEIRLLTKRYLGSYDIEQVRSSFFLGCSPPDIIANRVVTTSIVPSSQEEVRVCSVLGRSLEVSLNEEVSSIFLGFKCVVDEGKNPQWKMFFREFSLEQYEIQQLLELLKKAAIDVIKEMYACAWDENVFESVWERFESFSQTSTKVAKDRVLDKMISFLDELPEARNNLEIRNFLEEFEQATDDRAYYKDLLESLQKRSSSSQQIVDLKEKIKSFSKMRTKAQTGLKSLFEQSSIAHDAVLAGVRTKISDEAYRLHSIPFELFQNADDAYIELEEIGVISERSCQFSLSVTDECMIICHWGRMINQHRNGTEFDDRKRGFHQDLLKMLIFRSDKAFESDQVHEKKTGQFGLGFKSVHLLTKQPQILSGILGFKIVGGRLPIDLEEKQRTELRRHDPSYDLKGTIIQLPFDRDAPAVKSLLKEGQSFDTVVSTFNELAGILTVFAKRIRCCVVSDRTIQWQPAEIYSDIEVGDLDIKGQKEKAMCLRSSKDGVALLVLLDKETGCLKELPKGIPDIWVTAPTHEGMAADEEQSDREIVGLGFALNGKFDIGTGRTRLMPESPESEETARKIGEMVFEKLSQLFKDSNALAEIQRNLGMEIPIDRYSFWDSVWKILGKGWLNKRGRTEALHITRLALGGNNGIAKLLKNHALMPSGLSDRQLLSPEKIKFTVSGFSEKFYTKISHWKYQDDCLSGKTVSKKIWDNWTKLLNCPSNSHQIVEPVILVDILKAKLNESRNQISHSLDDELGKLILEIKQSNSSEYNDLEQLLCSELVLKFQSSNDIFVDCKELLLSNSTGEEKMIAKFAPLSSLLHSNYSNSACELFQICRKQRKTVDVKVWGDWAIKATSTTQREGVCEYLKKGEHNEALAKELLPRIQATWIASDSEIMSILNAYQQVRQAKGEEPRSMPSSLLLSQIVRPQRSVREILQNVYAEWATIKDQRIRDYVRTTYPNGQFPQLSADEDDLRSNITARSNWLILLFLGATHTIGRQSADQHRGFIKRCQDNGWWQIFAAPEPQNRANEWMGVIEEYLDGVGDDMQYFHWMRYFVTLYQLAIYLKEYTIDVFCAMNRQSTPLASLIHYLDTKTSPIYSRGGISVPPLTKTLGIGANFVVRELVRTEFINETAREYFFPHCFVPTRKVREHFHSLNPSGFTYIDLNNPDRKQSKKIHEFLTNQLEDPTFLNSFDLPFLYINELM